MFYSNFPKDVPDFRAENNLNNIEYLFDSKYSIIELFYALLLFYWKERCNIFLEAIVGHNKS